MRSMQCILIRMMRGVRYYFNPETEVSKWTLSMAGVMTVNRAARKWRRKAKALTSAEVGIIGRNAGQRGFHPPRNLSTG